MKTALSKIEEIYNMAINPELDYYAQLEPLAANGELANHNSSMKVLFALCMLVDQQGKRIAELEAADKKRNANIGTYIVKPDATKPLAQ